MVTALVPDTRAPGGAAPVGSKPHAAEEELLSVLNDEIRSIPEVQEIQIFMHLRTEKTVFAWGQRLGEE